MIPLRDFLVESLSEDIKKLIKKAKANETSAAFTIEKGSLGKIVKTKKPMSLDDIKNNAELMEMVVDKSYGFAVANQVISNPDNFFKDDSKLNPKCDLYFYSGHENDNNSSLVGICMYDDDAQYIEGLTHLVMIESAKIVENQKDLNLAMFKDFVKSKKDSGITGLTSKAINPKQKTGLVKLGFRQTKENKEIFSYIIK